MRCDLEGERKNGRGGNRGRERGRVWEGREGVREREGRWEVRLGWRLDEGVKGRAGD